MNSYSYLDIIESTIKDKRIIEAFKVIKREDFLPNDVKDYAHVDAPLPIGFGQTNSQPSLVAYMLKELELFEGAKILEIGTGCGFVTALLSYLVGPKGKVYSIEIIPELHEFAKKNIKKYDFTKNVRLICGSGYFGYKEGAPYDRIYVGASPPEIPKEIIEQLKDRGICVMPVGNYYQKLVKIKKENGNVKIEELMDVSFVPLVKS
jgi:protein-L-isoaspartate(D-aspartate) O-methyltransferase